MKKFIMVLAVCVLLAGVLAANGTLALPNVSEVFTVLTELLGTDDGVPTEDEAIFDVELLSQARDSNGKLVEMSTSPMLLPSVTADELKATEAVNVDGRTYSLWASGNKGIVDKFVSVVNKTTVKNTAEATESASVTHDACFRIAFAVQEEAFPFLYLNFNRADYEWTQWKNISIDGRAYRMIVATYPEALAVGETSPAALMQVALDRETTSADADRIAGDFLQIQVLAIDSAPFKNAEGIYSPEDALNAALPLENLNPF